MQMQPIVQLNEKQGSTQLREAGWSRERNHWRTRREMKRQANRGNGMRNEISSEIQVEMKGRTPEVTERNIKC